MRVLSYSLVAALLAALLSGCGLLFLAGDEGLDFNPGDGGDNGNGENSIVVSASGGVNPTFSWDGGGVHSVSVVRTSNPGSPVWAVAFLGTTDGIESGVVHGTVPGGSVEAIRTEGTLTAGVEYRVSVARTDETVGWTEFTP
jgi:hypothetical protein